MIKRSRILLLTFVLSLPILTLTGCKPNSDGAESAQGVGETAAIPVEAVKVKRETIAASYTGTASLEPEYEAQVVAKTSGVLMRLMVEEGSQVREGQLLAQLDAERAGLELARAEANLRKLENDFKRAEEMFSKKLISTENHDRVRYDLETQRAAYDLSKLELSYTRILAPISGVISQRLVKEGNLIQMHQALFRIDDFDPLLAVLNVPERELNTLKAGLDVQMLVDALGAKTFFGIVARVSPVVDPQTGTFRVTCEFRDPSRSLKTGMFGRIGVVYDQKLEAMVIPRDALIEEDNETAVFVTEIDQSFDKNKKKNEAEQKTGFFAKLFGGDKSKEEANKNKKTNTPPVLAHRRIVKVGYIAGDRVEIREGLKDGESVITVGRAAVREGSQVELLEAAQ